MPSSRAELANITEFHESDTGVCDACRRKSKKAVSVALPSLFYDYICVQCLFSLVAAVAKSQSSSPVGTPRSSPRTESNGESTDDLPFEGQPKQRSAK